MENSTKHRNTSFILAVTSSLIPALIIAIGVIGFTEISEARNTNEIKGVPAGFEMVRMTTDGEATGNLYTHYMDINECGEIVWERGRLSQRNSFEIYMYDNGEINQVTDDNNYDTGPAMNDNGEIVWVKGEGSQPANKVILYQEGQEQVIREVPAEPSAVGEPDINNSGNLVWREIGEVYSCQGNSEFHTFKTMFYDGKGVQQLFNGYPYSDQGLEINDENEIAFHRKDCADYWYNGNFWWTANVMKYKDGQFTNLTEGLSDEPGQHYIPNLNNLGDVAFQLSWFGEDRELAYWDESAGEVKIVETPEEYEEGVQGMNDKGDMIFWRWIDAESAYVSVLYSDGKFYQLNDISVSGFNFPESINNHGEVVLRRGQYPYVDLYLMRRERTGDMDQDNDVDGGDFNQFKSCFTGENAEDLRLCGYGQNCRFADMNHDNTVDCGDWEMFKANWDGNGSAPIYARCDLQNANNITEKKDPVSIWKR